MKWNYSRLKVFFLGVIVLVISMCISINILNVIDNFTPFEKIVMCWLMLVSITFSLYLIFWGIEPIMFEFKFWEKE